MLPCMTSDRFARFPAALAAQSRSARFGDVPVLLAHPDWSTPAPVVLWMHGRTVSKELDPGRYLRWIRAGIAACAIDLPGHGERFEASLQGLEAGPRLLGQMVREIDGIVEHLADPRYGGLFDLDRMGIGGMSAGGMAALRRLCDPHTFLCAAVEGTTGALALRRQAAGDPVMPELEALDPIRHLVHWRPIPILFLHSEADRIVPFSSVQTFITALREHYVRQGADPAMIEVATWPETGAPDEHLGFGRFSNDAKNRQTEFYKRLLLG